MKAIPRRTTKVPATPQATATSRPASSAWRMNSFSAKGRISQSISPAPR